MSLFSFSKKLAEKNVLILELGSGSVSGTIVRVGKNQLPLICYTTREQISFKENLQTDRILPLMLTTLDKVCSKIQKDGLLAIKSQVNTKINEVHLILSSPWSLSQTKIAAIHLEKPTTISNSYISKILLDQEKNAELSAKSFFESLHDKNDILVYEKKTIQIKLNGYKVSEVIGKVASNLDFAFLISLTPKLVIEDIKNVIGKYFSTSHLDIHSYTLSSLSVIRDIFPEKKSYTILDLSSELTDLSLVRDDIMSGGISFPFGRNHFVRNIAADLNVSIEEAFALLATYHSKNLNKIFEVKIKNSLAEVMKLWSGELKKSLEILSKEAYIPRTIFKVTNDDFGNFFADQLNKETYSQLGFSQEPFNVIKLDKVTIEKYCKLDSGVRNDVFTIVNAIYINKLFNL